MNRSSWTLLTVFVAGLMILILPDDGDPVFRFTKLHGPSWPDLAGLLLMLGSWLVSCMIVVSRWKQVTENAGKTYTYLLICLYCLFVAGVVASLVLSVEWILWPCVVVASLINVFFILFAYGAKRSGR